MRTPSRVASALLLGGLMFVQPAITAQAQQPAQQTSNQQQAEAAAEANKRAIEEFLEAARLPGAAGKAECVWLGRRIASLLWRDDVDTARRHIEIYDRFSCPSDHLRLTFRCVVRQGNIDPKAPESLPQRIHSCWMNPEGPSATTAQ